MKMTTRGRYGLRAILELARCWGGPPLLMSTLAEREGLSRKYLHALLTSLKAAGLVQSSRGAGGGFRLARPPAEIRLNDVLRAVEGPLSIVGCVARPRSCSRSGRCTARRVWTEVSQAIDQALERFTLQSLITLEPDLGAGAGALGNPPSPPPVANPRSKRRTRRGKTSPAPNP